MKTQQQGQKAKIKVQPATKYIIEMYRAYGAAGQPEVEEVKQAIQEYYTAGKQNKNELAYLNDLLAIATVMERLEAEEKGQDIKVIIQATYMQMRDTRRGTITDTVSKASIKHYIGEATVYRYLKQARIMAAEEKGLRIF